MPAKSLTQVLGQSEHVNQLIKQSAQELCSDKIAVDENEAVRRKLQDASARLATVNQTLVGEVRERTMIDHQFAAATEQTEGARHAALHDHLTGLASRVLFNDRLEHAIAQAKRHRWMLAVMFLDLDKFKSINDTYGHQAGDAVLQTIAKRLQRNTRDEDTIGRYGGDEFLYLLAQIREQKDIAMIAGKILKAITAPCRVSAPDLIVTPCLEASIGISLFPRDGATASALIKRADEAMYEAKENKSGYAFASS